MKIPGPVESDAVRDRLDLVFSRRVLGAVIVAVAAKKMIALGFYLLLAGTLARFAAWTAVFVLSIVLFVWWEHAERTTERAARAATEGAAVAAEKAADEAAETTGHEKIRAAERATDAVADRVSRSSSDESTASQGSDSGTDAGSGSERDSDSD